MRIVVTGAAGFIGSNLVRRLNKEGLKTEVLLVDRIDNPAKTQNVSDLKFHDIVDYDDSDIEKLIDEFNDGDLVVFHQGACSDTMNHDKQYMLDMNYTRSKWWLDYCHTRSARFIYASSAAVYGSGKRGFSLGCEDPLNVYGLSKFMFDQYVQNTLECSANQIVGLRYFNVYGPGELHKGNMSSCVLQFYRQSLTGVIDVFKGSKNFKRDFIYIDDVIDTNIFFLRNKQHSGIFNCGTGNARSFYDIASIISSMCVQNDPMSLSQDARNIDRRVIIREIEMPHGLERNYQNFTQADMAALGSIGFSPRYISLEDGIERYISGLNI